MDVQYERYGDLEKCSNLLQLIFENRNALQYLYLDNLNSISTDMDIFLNCIALCTNLVELSLYSTSLHLKIFLYGATQLII